MEELALSFLPSHDWSLAEQVQLQSDVGNGDGAEACLFKSSGPLMFILLDVDASCSIHDIHICRSELQKVAQCFWDQLDLKCLK